MKKTIIACIIIIAVFIITGYSIVSGSDSVKTYSKAELVSLIAEQQQIKDTSHDMANNARELGWTDNDKILKEIKNKWYVADTTQKKYQKLLDAILEEEKAEEDRKWASKAAEYPEATYIWRYMKSLGWNDYVCAGIMGNIMTEVGGQTLNINYKASSKAYYGMCQWSKGYYEVWGADLPTQCKFLEDSIRYEFDTFGFVYRNGFKFNSFLNITDAKQAALAFAKCYERCGSGSYTIRQNNAVKAYNYFVS